MTTNKNIISEDEILTIINRDRFRPSLKCDLFIPSYIHSLSIATEFMFNYIKSRFPSNYFKCTYVTGQHPYEEIHTTKPKDMILTERPSMALTYTLQYDYNDNMADWNLLSTNHYLKKNQWQRSFFKNPSKGLYIGMEMEAMMIEYNTKIMVYTRPEQIDLFNRMRKVFRIGCTETIDLDCDFCMDRELITYLAKEAGFAIDTVSGEVLDYRNFLKFLNQYSQIPILYKLRGINNKYEYFIRMRNMPVHLDMTNALSVDDGDSAGFMNTNYSIEMPITVRFPALKSLILYNEGNWEHKINVEPNEGINLISFKLMDIPEANHKGWPMYGHSNYVPEDDEKIVESIDISELFKAPLDIKLGSDLDSIITDAINQSLNPDTFIEIAVYVNDAGIDNNGRIPILMDWVNRKIILPANTTSQYYYLAIYIDRSYVNEKVIELTKANTNRIVESPQTNLESEIRSHYIEEHPVEEYKVTSTNLPKPKHARFVVNKPSRRK